MTFMIPPHMTQTYLDRRQHELAAAAEKRRLAVDASPRATLRPARTRLITRAGRLLSWRPRPAAARYEAVLSAIDESLLHWRR
jgi:hypothetical protein